MTNEELLSELAQETYVALQPSPVHGIGVFAIRDIPKGNRTMFSKENGDWTKVPFEQVESLPEHSKRLIETYCIFDEESYYIEKTGFKKMDLINFLNHSDSPNLGLIKGEFFETLADVKCGDELFINYSDFD